MRCHLCGKEFDVNHSRSHIYLHHRWKIKDYYDKFLKRDDEGVCEFCDKETTFQSMSKGYRRSCKFHSFEIAKKTIFDKYGVDNISQLDSVKKKKEDTCLKNHGYKSKLHKEARSDLRRMNLEKFGVENLSSLQSIKNKIKNTFNIRYGYECALQVDEFKSKFQQTCIEKFGYDNPMSNSDISEKARLTCFLRYGFNSPMKSEIFKKKSKDTCMLKFGVDNHSKTFESRLKSRKMLIERIKKENGDKINPMRGRGEKPCFDELEKHIQFKIDRDFTEIGYFPDGFIHELNLVIEFDEREHQIREWYKKHDKRRDEDFKKIGYETFRIKQTEWDNEINRASIISQIINKMEIIMKEKKEKKDKKKKKIVVDKNITEKLSAPKTAKIIME